MDPLSDVLSHLKPQSYVSGGFKIGKNLAIQWPIHEGIKCYAVVSGECWLTVEGVAEPVRLTAGECYLLPPGPSFTLATDLSATPIDFRTLKLGKFKGFTTSQEGADGCDLVGGHFGLTGSNSDILLKALPTIVHIRSEAEKAAMRWSLERMNEELRDPKPASSVITQHLAFMMLAQALRLHLANESNDRVGWLFALGDKQLCGAITCMHEDPGYSWTLENLATRIGMSRSLFALRFKEKVGKTPMEYLTRWRMILASEKLKNPGETIFGIASALGYESESAFGKAFKRTMGCSPRQHSRQAHSQVNSEVEIETSHNGSSDLPNGGASSVSLGQPR